MSHKIETRHPCTLAGGLQGGAAYLTYGHSTHQGLKEVNISVFRMHVGPHERKPPGRAILRFRHGAHDQRASHSEWDEVA